MGRGALAPSSLFLAICRLPGHPALTHLAQMTPWGDEGVVAVMAM